MSGDGGDKAAPAAKGRGAVSKPTPKAPASKPGKAAAAVLTKAKAPARPETSSPAKTKVARRKPDPKPKAYVPTDQARRTVEAMAAYRISQDEIAAVHGIDADTLRKHFRPELDAAAAKLEARLNEALSIQALGAPAEYYPPGHPNAGALARAEQKRYAPAAIFLLRHAEGLKDRAAKRENDRLELLHRHEIEKADAEARRKLDEKSAVIDLEDLTPVELDVLERVFRRQIDRNAVNGV